MKILKSVGLGFLAFIVGIGLFFAGVVAVEAYSSVVHPFPEDFDGSHEQVCKHVERYPAWVLASVIPMWAAAAFAGVWVTRRIGNVAPAVALGILLLALVVLNVSMLPYPIWFSVGSLIAVPAASMVAARLGRKSVGMVPEDRIVK